MQIIELKDFKIIFDTSINIDNLSKAIFDNKLIYVGRTTKISEDIAKLIVETVQVEIVPSPSNDMQGDYDYCYKDYKDTSECEWVGFGSNANGFKNGKDSFQSLSDLEYCIITKI